MTIIKSCQLNRNVKLGIAVAEFNADITHQLLENALKHLQQCGISEDAVIIVHVPGAVELGLAAQQLITRANCDAVIVFGAVIKGESAHFDYVSKSCVDACNQVMLTHDKPVIFGVLTVFSQQQALERIDGTKASMGSEAVDTCLTMLSIGDQLRHCE